jgi:hypothetical protein
MPIDEYISAFMMGCMVFLGGVYMFYSNKWRGVHGSAVHFAQIATGVAALACSCVLFAIVLWAILSPIMDEKCGKVGNATAPGKCPIVDPLLKRDAGAVVTLSCVWIGYPIVALMPCSSFARNNWVSIFKDAAYGILDVVSKAGLAVYVSYRTTWVRV